MGILRGIVTVLYVLICIALVVIVLFQESKSQGLSGSIAGGSDTFFGKNKGKTNEKKLSMITTIVAIVFVVIVVAMYAIQPDINFNATIPDIGLDSGAEGYQGIVVTTEAPSTTEAPVVTTAAE